MSKDNEFAEKTESSEKDQSEEMECDDEEEDEGSEEKYGQTLNVPQTFGEKPKCFQVEEDGEYWYIGSSVGNFLHLFRGILYRKYPGLERHLASKEERLKMAELNLGREVSASNIVLIKASEVEEILQGRGQKYIDTVKPTLMRKTRNSEAKKETAEMGTPGGTSKSRSTRQSWTPGSGLTNIYSANSHHLDAVACSTPLSKNKSQAIWRKRRRVYPLADLARDYDKLLQNADEEEVLVPIRLDMEIEGQRLRDVLTWNKNEKLISIDLFAQLLCEDLELNPEAFVGPIVNSMKNQIDEFPTANLLAEQPDQRVIIKLNINVGNISLIDQFEWDMQASENDPEELLENYAQIWVLVANLLALLHIRFERNLLGIRA